MRGLQSEIQWESKLSARRGALVGPADRPESPERMKAVLKGAIRPVFPPRFYFPAAPTQPARHAAGYATHSHQHASNQIQVASVP